MSSYSPPPRRRAVARRKRAHGSPLALGALGLGGTILGLAHHADAANFTNGNVVVYRVGTGSGALSANSAAVFLDEYSPTGTLVQSVAMPTIDSGSNQTLTATGNNITEGLITRSVDGRFLVLGGYDAATGTANVATTNVARTIGRVNAAATINTTTTISTTFNAATFRGAASNNGSGFWAGASSGGLVYQPLGSTGAGTVVSTTITDNNQPNIFGGQLYATTGSNTARIAKVGTGLPTTTGQTMTDTGVGNSGSPYQFFFADLTNTVAGFDTLYVANDNQSALKKYALVGGTWTVASTTGNNNDDYHGLTGVVSGSTVTLYVVKGTGTLEKIVDSSGYNAAINGAEVTIATAGSNTQFRGVALTPAGMGNFTVPGSVTLNVLRNAPTTIIGSITTTNTSVIGDDYTATPGGSLSVANPTAFVAGSGGTDAINIGVASTGSFGTQSGTITVTPSTGSNVASVSVNVGNATAQNAFNDRTHFGTALIGKVNSGNSYANLESKVVAATGTAGAGIFGTIATIKAGTASGDTTVAMAWRARNKNEVSGFSTTPPFGAFTPGAGLASDVVDLTGIRASGVGSNHGSHQTDIFVLQMTYNEAEIAKITALPETTAATKKLIALGYLDLGADGTAGTVDDRWSLAVNGNFGGGNIFAGNVPFTDTGSPGLSDDLGRWGVDTGNNVVWAVLNHNSQFAAIPEPTTLGISGFVGAAMLGQRRRKRRGPKRR